MKVLIIGGGGTLGHKLVQAWGDKFEVWTTIRGTFENYQRFGIYNPKRVLENIDVENLPSIKSAIKKVEPEIIVNAVGVIKQSPSAKNVIQTLSINAIFPHRLAEIADQVNARLISISTDCVFSGTHGNYSESDIPDAHDLYGRSKQLGEVIDNRNLTIRTSIIGRELSSGRSLVEWFLSNRGKSVKGFTKAVFSGFPTIILADILEDIIKKHSTLNGLYHISSDPINKFDLLSSIKKAYRADIKIEPFEDFQIDRSLDSTKFKQVTGFRPLEWNEMIEQMAADDALYKLRNL